MAIQIPIKRIDPKNWATASGEAALETEALLVWIVGKISI
jgi:hypothetical protein